MPIRPNQTRTNAEQRRFDELLRNLPINDRETPLPQPKLKLAKVRRGHLLKLEQR